MSALHHQRLDEYWDTCQYCLEEWPCPTAQVRYEVLRAILGKITYQASVELPDTAGGLEFAADIVRKELER